MGDVGQSPIFLINHFNHQPGGGGAIMGIRSPSSRVHRWNWETSMKPKWA